MEPIIFWPGGSGEITRLMERLSHADLHGKSVRFATGRGSVRGADGEPVERNWLKYKIGEGSWSPPIYDQPESDYARDTRKPAPWEPTHESAHDGSPARFIRRNGSGVLMENEDGDRWTDPESDWVHI